MPLKIKVNISVSNTKCNALNVYEKTNAFADPNNLTGWGSTNGVDTDSIVTSTVVIFDYLGTTALKTIVLKDNSINLYSGLTGDPTPVESLIVANTSWNQPDGIFLIDYTIIDEQDVIYKNDKQYVLFLCKLCNCINNLKIKATKECDSKKLQKIKTQIDQLEIIKYGIESAFSCKDFTTALTLLASATKICTALSDCGCGCNDC